MTDHEFKAPERTITAPDETTARLGEIRERVAAATEGPWEHGDRQFTAGVNERFGTDACAHCRRHGDPTWIGVRDINGQKMLTHVHTDAEPWWKHGIFAFRDSGSSVVVHDTEYGYMDQADAEFIAHAREDVPWLMAEVELLTGERDRARELAARLEEQVARVEALAVVVANRMMATAKPSEIWAALRGEGACEGSPMCPGGTHAEGCYSLAWTAADWQQCTDSRCLTPCMECAEAALTGAGGE